MLEALLVALVALFCADVTRPVTPEAGMELAVASAANATRWAAEPSHRCEGGVGGTVHDLQAVEVEADDDGDGDALWESADDATIGLRRTTFPTRIRQAMRAASAIDPSRFGVSAGLPRGPPV